MKSYYQPLELINWQPRHQTTVLSAGLPQAKLMIIGNTPGTHEEHQGNPFDGSAGQLMTAMLQSIGFTRDEVYITNLLEFRDTEACTTFLNQQIKLLQPTLLLAIGQAAARFLLHTDATLESLRGRLHTIGKDQPSLIVTYHPADLIRSPLDKKKAYIDLQLTQKALTTPSNISLI